MNRILVASMLGTVLLMGCITVLPPPTLTPEGEKVRIATADPSGTCKDLGAVVGNWGGKNYRVNGDAEELNVLRTFARNKVAELGGNVFRLESEQRYVGRLQSLTGTAFKCP